MVSGEFERIPLDTKELTDEQRETVDKLLEKLEEDDEKEIEEFEIKVFSRVPLNRMIGEKLFVTFSQHDFSVCYPVMKEGR